MGVRVREGEGAPLEVHPRPESPPGGLILGFRWHAFERCLGEASAGLAEVAHVRTCARAWFVILSILDPRVAPPSPPNGRVLSCVKHHVRQLYPDAPTKAYF